MADRESNYQQLLEKIVDLAERQDQAYADQLMCRAGCDACCEPPDSLFLPEAGVLEAGIQALPLEAKQAIQRRLDAYKAGERSKCPLLEEGACTVYEARPTICRTQGYALWYRSEGKEGEGLMTWCDLNFTSRTPERDLAFDAERMNVMLSLITQLGWPKQEARRPLTDIIETGLFPSA